MILNKFIIKNLLSLLLSVAVIMTIEQAYSQQDQDTANRSDEKGLKQGYWKKFDEGGLLKYEGRFIDDKPVGEFVYYYPDETVKARSTFFDDGKGSFTTTFHHTGTKMTEGYY
jgi:antitoxin component YwqK of YwqJK toxin-antitoxin module